MADSAEIGYVGPNAASPKMDDFGFGQFLVDASSYLSNDTVRKLATIFRFPPAQFDRVGGDSLEFVRVLDEEGIITSTDISALTNALHSIDRGGIAAEVQQSFERNQTRGPGEPRMLSSELQRKHHLLVTALKEVYKRRYGGVKPIPFHHERWYCVNDIFVENKIEVRDKTASKEDPGRWFPIKTRHELFTKRNFEKHITIEGEPGFGKSTLLLQYAYDWCTSSPESPLNSSYIFVLLCLKDIADTPTIFDAIKMMLPEDLPVTSQDIRDILTSGRWKLVLALDGYDEYSSINIKDTDINKVIQGRILTESIVIISTRPPCLPKLQGPTVTHCRLTGFDQDKQEEYIDKVIISQAATGGMKELVMRRLKENVVLSDICQVPFFFATFAHMHSTGLEYHRVKSVTSYFTFMIASFFGHLENKTTDVSGQTENSDQRLQIAKLAFEGLISEQQTLIWKEGDLLKLLQPPCYNRYVNAGILLKEQQRLFRVTSGSHADDQLEVTTHVRFFHKTFQEFYAAHYIAYLSDRQSSDAMMKTLSAFDIVNYQYVMCFACGLKPTAARVVQDYLNTLGKDGKTFSILCLMEQESGAADRLIAQLCSTHVRFSFLDSRLLQRSTIQLLQTASQRKIRISGVMLFDLFQSVDLKEESLCLSSGLQIPRLDTLQKLEIWQSGDLRDRARDILDYCCKCAALKSLKFELALGYLLLPQSFEDRDVLASLYRKNCIVQWKYYDRYHAQVVWTLNLTTGTWENRAGNVMTDEEYKYVNRASNVMTDEEYKYVNRAGKVVTDEEHKYVVENIGKNPTTAEFSKRSTFRRIVGREKDEIQKLDVIQGESAPSDIAPIQPADLRSSLETVKTITMEGGLLQIPNTDVTLAIPPNALPEGMEQCTVKMRIIPQQMKDQGTHFSSNSSTVVELLPNGLILKRPVRLRLPHCLVLEEVPEHSAQIFISHHAEGCSPSWEECKHLSYHLEDASCTILLDSFCWVAYSISDRIVLAKKIVVYVAARNLLQQDATAEIQIGYYVDLPGADQFLAQNRCLAVSHKTYYFLKRSKQYPLRVNIAKIFPSDSWQRSYPDTHFQEIPYGTVSTCCKCSRVYLFEKTSVEAGSILCIFTASQEKGQMPIELAVHLQVVHKDRLPSPLVDPSCENHSSAASGSMFITAKVTNSGGKLEIPNTGVVLDILSDSLPIGMDQCVIQMRIIPGRVVEDQVKSVCSNSSTAVELLPENIRLRRPAKLSLPHCLKLDENKTRTARIYLSHYQHGIPSGWEQAQIVYNLDDKVCKIQLNELCCVKYSIDDSIVTAKKIVVYTAAKPIERKDGLAEVEIGYYSDIPGGGELLRLNPNLVVDCKETLDVMEEERYPLQLSLDAIRPSWWECCFPQEMPQEIPFGAIASSIEHSYLYIIQTSRRQYGNPICVFAASQVGIYVTIQPTVKVIHQAEENVVPSKPSMSTNESKAGASYLPMVGSSSGELDSGSGTTASHHTVEPHHMTAELHQRSEVMSGREWRPCRGKQPPEVHNISVQQYHYNTQVNMNPVSSMIPIGGIHDPCELHCHGNSERRKDHGLTHSLLLSIAKKLDTQNVLGNDWRLLAENLGYLLEDTEVFGRSPSPTYTVINSAFQSGKLNSLEQLRTVLLEIKRGDAAKCIPE